MTTRANASTVAVMVTMNLVRSAVLDGLEEGNPRDFAQPGTFDVFGEVPLERVVAGQCPVAAPSGLAFGTDNTADRHDYNRLASFILDLNLQV
jgi:hypothetical protein